MKCQPGESITCAICESGTFGGYCVFCVLCVHLSWTAAGRGKNDIQTSYSQKAMAILSLLQHGLRIYRVLPQVCHSSRRTDGHRKLDWTPNKQNVSRDLKTELQNPKSKSPSSIFQSNPELKAWRSPTHPRTLTKHPAQAAWQQLMS